MTDNIRISIIMPVYNSGSYLKTAVDSILNQSLREIELILVDDGSTDGSSDRCDEYARVDNRVVVVHQNNGGICKARNAAIRIARGEYIGFSDHDDEYVPGYLEHAYAEAVKQKADLVKVGKKEFILKDGKLIRTKQAVLPHRVYHKADIQKEYFDLVNSNELECLWDALIKREVLTGNDLWLNEDLKHGGEDIEFMQRLLPYIDILVTIDKIYYWHYIRKGFSTSSKWNPAVLEAKRVIADVMLETMKLLHINIEESKFKYTYHFLRQYIAPCCAFYANEACTFTECEKKVALGNMKRMHFYKSFCDKQSTFQAFKLSSKYGLLYFLFKHNLYGLILKIYRKRNKNS